MKLTKNNLKKLIKDKYDVRIDTFIFEKDGDKYLALSKFEGVNVEVRASDAAWKSTVVNHVNWQLQLNVAVK